MRTTSVLHVRTPGGLEIHLDDAAGRVTIAGQGLDDPHRLHGDHDPGRRQGRHRGGAGEGQRRHGRGRRGHVEVQRRRAVRHPDRQLGRGRELHPRRRQRVASVAGQAPPRDADRLGVASISTKRRPSVARDRAERARAGEGVQAPAARARGGGDHPAHDALGLLRRVAGLLAPVGRHDRVPPASVGRLPRAAFSGPTRPGRHVGLAVDLVVVEVVARRRSLT